MIKENIEAMNSIQALIEFFQTNIKPTHPIVAKFAITALHAIHTSVYDVGVETTSNS